MEGGAGAQALPSLGPAWLCTAPLCPSPGVGVEEGRECQPLQGDLSLSLLLEGHIPDLGELRLMPS